MFEEWAGSEEDWSKSNLIIQMKSRNKHSKKGCRRWLTQREISDKYSSEEIAADIVRLKLEDSKARASTVRDHPDLPGREDMRQFLVFDYSEETDERDEILESLFSMEEGSDQEDVPTASGRSRSHAKKKDSRTPKKKRRSTSSSSSSSTRKSSSSDSSRSSHSAKTSKTKKTKHGKKAKKEKKRKHNSPDKNKDPEMTEAQKKKAEKAKAKEEEAQRKKAEREEEKRQKDEKKEMQRAEERKEKEEKRQMEKEKDRKRAVAKKEPL